MERQLVFELPNDLQCIEETVEFVISRCTTCAEVERKLRLNFRVSLCEALANAMIYGNGRDPSKQVHVEVFVEGTRLMARITDEGPGFDPHTVPDPTVPRNLQRNSGRGIFLMRELMDEVRYNDRGNSVTLTLTLPDQNGLSPGANA